MAQLAQTVSAARPELPGAARPCGFAPSAASRGLPQPSLHFWRGGTASVLQACGSASSHPRYTIVAPSNNITTTPGDSSVVCSEPAGRRSCSSEPAELAAARGFGTQAHAVQSPAVDQLTRGDGCMRPFYGTRAHGLPLTCESRLSCAPLADTTPAMRHRLHVYVASSTGRSKRESGHGGRRPHAPKADLECCGVRGRRAIDKSSKAIMRLSCWKDRTDMAPVLQAGRTARSRRRAS